MVPVASENREIIKAAAELVKARSQDDPRVWAPPDWREIDLEYPAQQVVRLRPAGDDATSVEVFRWGDLLASETVRRYHSADGLADLIEDVHARSRDSA